MALVASAAAGAIGTTAWGLQVKDEPIAPAKKDRYLIKAVLDPAAKAPLAEPVGSDDAASETRSGRLILFFVPATSRWEATTPAAGPFLNTALPIASVAVRDFAQGGEIRVEADPIAPTTDGVGALAMLAELDGAWRVQAVFDSDFNEPGHLGPGNLFSEPMRIELARDRTDEIVLELNARVEESADIAPQTASGVERFERPSKILSGALRRPASLRAAVVLPYGYDDLAFPRRMWPTVYVIGDFGSDELEALAAAPALRDPGARAAVPQAVWVFLDASTPWGYGGFCDSAANGPMQRALVDEFIPALEERFRLIAKADARVLLGHGFGGWSAIHLALSAPSTFGSCYAIAPDFVDFSALGRIDLYRDATLFTMRDGADAPAVRSILGPNDDRLHLTLRDQVFAERAIDPDGRSGQRWAARDAMWSPWNAERNAPHAICDAVTGAIDPVAGESWSRVDIAKRLERDPSTVGPLLAERVHILCSTRDSFYRNEAIARLKAKLDAWRARETAAGRTPSDRGSIEIVDGLDDEALRQLAVLRFHRQIAADLRAVGHVDPLRLDEGTRATRPSGDARPTPAPRPGG
jgi:S-formylglutathione hydrolase FrmB